MASAKNRLHLQAKKIGELHQQLAAAQAEAEAIRAVRIEATRVAMQAAREIIRDELSGDQADALLNQAIEDLPRRLS